MCGIAGVAGPKATITLTRAMTDAIAHRGPDGDGHYVGANVCLGHRRLAIIDLVTGDQPMTNEDQTLWVVFNGEIYNFKDLRQELEEYGHRFKTTSDTEVLLHGYEQWGAGLFPRLDGIFAFALWDVVKDRLTLVRDYFGIKPLHYYVSAGNLYFSSEIKALFQSPDVPREIDFQALHYFMNLRYIPGERTLFKSIRRLLPAYFMTFRPGDSAPSFHKYFQTEFHPGRPSSEEDYKEGIRHYLEMAVKKQLISDVPLGVYLSGGLDSSSLVAFMSRHRSEPVKSFSLGFNEPTDELDDAKIVADHFQTEHHSISLSPDPLQSYPTVIWHAEEPKENVLQGFLLARFASKQVKVALGGLGGDELFAGYINNQFIYPSEHLHPLVPPFVSKALFAPMSRLAFMLQNASGLLSMDEYRRGLQMLLSIGDPARYYLILRNTWDFDHGAFGNLYGPAWEGNRPDPVVDIFRPYFTSRKGMLRQTLTAEFHTKMVEDFLMNEDRTSMAHGLEVRVPFLDRDLVEFAYSIPVNLLIKRNRTKHIFFEAMEGILPKQTLAKKKWGFSFNPYYQFQKDLKTVAQNILTRRRVKERGWFNYDYLQKIMNHPPHKRLRWHYFVLWLAMGLEIWSAMFLDGNSSQPDFNLESYYDRT